MLSTSGGRRRERRGAAGKPIEVAVKGRERHNLAGVDDRWIRPKALVGRVIEEVGKSGADLRFGDSPVKFCRQIITDNAVQAFAGLNRVRDSGAGRCERWHSWVGRGRTGDGRRRDCRGCDRGGGG